MRPMVAELLKKRTIPILSKLKVEEEELNQKGGVFREVRCNNQLVDPKSVGSDNVVLVISLKRNEPKIPHTAM